MQLTIKRAREAHPLASIVLRQLGGGKDAISSAIEAGEHGADAGWPGFTWHSDTVPWAKRHRAAILKACRDMMDDLGEPGTIAQFLGTFRCLRDYRPVDIESALGSYPTDEDITTAVYNALAWFALEEVGRALANAAEGDE